MGENTTPQGSNNVEKALGWIGKASELIQKVGFQNFIITIMVLFLVIVVGQAAFNPEGFIKRIEAAQAKNHTESVMKRIEVTPAIRAALINLKGSAESDRAFILETHNGGSNLSNLPFLYVDLTYAEPRGEMEWLEDEYKNVRLSRYPWASYLYENSYWFGSIEDMKELDPELYYRLLGEGVKYMGTILMFGTYNPCGVLGVVYTDENLPSPLVIKQNLVKYGTTISQLLNNE